MTLASEDTQERGPNGLHAISVAHYGERNGDSMRDPEMIFEAEESKRANESGAILLAERLRGIEPYFAFVEEGPS